jgi:hypothetical protein
VSSIPITNPSRMKGGVSHGRRGNLCENHTNFIVGVVKLKFIRGV